MLAEGYRYATYISGRQLFYDWENEEPIALTITPLDNIGGPPSALAAEKTAAQLRRMGSIIHGQMKFWLQFYDVELNVNGSHENTQGSPFFMPVNGYKAPNAASSDTGGGISTKFGAVANSVTCCSKSDPGFSWANNLAVRSLSDGFLPRLLIILPHFELPLLKHVHDFKPLDGGIRRFH